MEHCRTHTVKRETQRAQCAGSSEAQTVCHAGDTTFLITTAELKHFLQLLLGPRTAAKSRWWSLEFLGAPALSGGGRWQHLQTRGHQCSRAACLHPAHYSRFVIVPRLFSLWRKQRKEGCLAVPDLSALRKDPGLPLLSGIKVKFWEKAMHAVNTGI